MNRLLLIGPLALALLSEASFASETKISPSFGCSSAAYADGLSRMICESPDLSRSEMSFAQVYFARRFLVGESGRTALRSESHMVSAAIRRTCGIPDQAARDQTLPVGASACYAAETVKYRGVWLSKLYGSAREEASRPVEQNIALQQRLIDRGYLPPKTTADGVFGEATRTAISTWQRVAGRPSADGFLSDSDSDTLLAPTSSDSVSEPVASAGGPETTEVRNAPEDDTTHSLLSTLLNQPPQPTDDTEPVRDVPPAMVAPPVAPPSDTTSVSPASVAETGPRSDEPMTVIDFLTDARNLNAHRVWVQGTVFCRSGEICYVTDGSAKLEFSAESLDRDVRKVLLECGSGLHFCKATVSGMAITAFAVPNIIAEDVFFSYRFGLFD